MNFWYRLWEDAGHPSSGVLFQIKKNTKTRYKYEIRHLKRRHNVLLQDIFTSLFTSKKKDDFWYQIRQLNRSRPSPASSVDNVSGDFNIVQICLLLNLPMSIPPVTLFIPLFNPQSNRGICVMYTSLMRRYLKLFLCSS